MVRSNKTPFRGWGSPQIKDENLGGLGGGRECTHVPCPLMDKIAVMDDWHIA